ncbi:hypothetical protein EIP91_009982 [Steccherinum ochraceum]|uniref:Uncharacterized protein n=1 Tax=Steccherinum ochraceum TaxID=92696 RepID=A0A4R0RX75_9APHY|nr:hypothetical protein EIP91_009982 [Steccherinum ochraceum]
MSRNRVWTEETIREWIQRREAYVERQTGRPLAQIRASEDPKDVKLLDTILKGEKNVLYKRSHETDTKTLAWEIQKHPFVAYPAPIAGTLHLSHHLRETNGLSKIQFREGDDLNAAVFAFYNTTTPPDYPGYNYVTTDGLISKRNDYLGPAPYVAGYQFAFDSNDCYVEWWDAYLREKWTGTRRWEHEPYWDETVHGWVLKRRGWFGVYLDDTEYVGYKE